MSELRIYRADECGPDGYPHAWHASIKHRVREDAGNRCIRCGHPYAKGAGEWSPCDEHCTHRGPYRYRHGDGDPWFFTEEDEPWIGEACLGSEVGIEIHARWRILTVHHLNGVKHDCRWWNLAALCQRCHLQIQGRVQMERVWPWEHSDWFKPHAAGWYAFAYLDEDITREEAVARMDELLALERSA
ncbi:MAG TPA: hypothetical protein VFH80_10290 [Solirubrobacteraceae bacterium]|nr:hypothetical protein [Solirubrobacteraceae bacterium]